MQHAPRVKRRLWRPWLWPEKYLGSIFAPVPFGTAVINLVVQRILGVNNNIPWMVHFTSTVTGCISIGENVWKSFAMSSGCYIQGINGVEIGDDTIFAPGVKIISANHDQRRHNEHISSTPVTIGKRCWIGANAVILPGVTIGDNVVVAAGAVVTKSIPSNSVIAGVPAKLIRTIDSNEDTL